MRALTLRARLALAGLFALSAGAARADVQAIPVTTVGTEPPVTASGFNYFQSPGSYTFSWDFTANSAISVTQLGYYNSALTGAANDGGFGSHLVTLTDLSTDTTLAVATVTAASPVTGDFNYAPISPVTLNTTDTYEVSGNMTTQNYLVGLNKSVTPTASAINYIFVPGNIFDSISPAGTYSDFGPNFQFAPASTCTENVSGRNIIALSGDSCTAAPGAYHPTTSAVSLPTTYNAFGFFAAGGSIVSPGDVSITTASASQSGAHAIWADGANSTITLQGATTLTTVQNVSHGLYATGGGVITATGAVNATVSGAGSSAVYASGAGSQISFTGGGTLTGSGANAPLVQADGGATVTLGGSGVTTTLSNTNADGANGSLLYATGSGTSITATGATMSFSAAGGGNGLVANNSATISIVGGSIASTGAFVVNAAAFNAGVLTLTGTTLTASGDGTETLWAANGGTVTGSGLTIRATGGVYGTDGGLKVLAGGASNNAYGDNTTGGTLSLSASDIRTTGFGVLTANGGVTTLNGDTIVVTGPNGYGVASVGNSSITISGGSVSTSGAGTPALWATGAGAAIQAAPAETSALTIATTGAGANGVQADGGGAVTLGNSSTATSVTVSGQNSQLYYATGAGSSLSATNVTAVIDGGNRGGYGVFADKSAAITITNGSITSDASFSPSVTAQNAATITLTGTSITASGDGASGLWATQGGSIQGSHVSITATGGIDEASGLGSTGVANNGYNTTTGGGALTLADSSVLVTGASGHGVYAADGGVTTLTRDLVHVDGANAVGVESGAGGAITIHGGAVETTGAGSYGLLASALVTGGLGGQPGQISADTDSNIGLRVTTSGGLSHGVVAISGGSVSLTGGSVTTSGDGAVGLYATAAKSSVSATGVAVSTSGAASANAIYAGGGGTVGASGGSAATQGADSYVVAVANGGSVKLTGLGLTSSGTGDGQRRGLQLHRGQSQHFDERRLRFRERRQRRL